MRALTLFLSLTLLVSASHSWAKSPVEVSDCETRLDGTKQNYKSIIQDLRAMGLKNLLAPLDNAKTEVSFREKNFFWQANVTFRFGWFFKDKLIVRKLKWKNEKQHQKAIWKVALALYNLQAPRRLWDLRALQPKTEVPEFELTPDGAFGALEYFLYRYPADWRDNENGRRTALNLELKAVLDSLPLVKEPLPEVSRVKFISFWEDHFKRVAMVGMVCMIPKLFDVPRCFNAFEVSTKKQYELISDVSKQEQVTQRYRDILFTEVREEIKELKAKLPDPQAAAELDELYRQYPIRPRLA